MEWGMYFFRSGLVLGLFCAVYYVFLRKDSHFSMNRFFLLMGLISSAFLPFAIIRYTIFVDGGSVANQDFFTPIVLHPNVSPGVVVQKTNALSWFALLVGSYLLIVGLMLFRLLLQLVNVSLIKRKSEKHVWKGLDVFVHPEVKTPFVFYNRIYLNSRSYLQDNYAAILTHERIHLMQHHWIDVLLSEIFIAFQWFNPLAWYYGKVIKQNLEFLADRGVLEAGFKLENYLQTIICETMGAEAIVLANHFRFSQNKRRLKMMKIVKTSKWRQLKLLFALPILGVLLWAFSEPVYRFSESQSITTSVVEVEKGVIKEKFKLKGMVLSSCDTTLVQDPENGEYIEKIIGLGLPGTSIVIKGTSIGTVSDEDGRFSLPVSNGDILVFSFVGFETREVLANDTKNLDVLMKEQAYRLEPGQFRSKYKGKLTPPPPPPVSDDNSKMIPPPPPSPPSSDESEFYVVETMPEYKGGMEMYFASLYTLAARIGKEQDLAGHVNVEFTVNNKGEVVQVHPLDKIDSREALEATRIVRELNNWKPGKQRGKAVFCKLVVPVEF